MTATQTTQALWITAAGIAETRETDCVILEGHLDIKTQFSGISRGTERLVFKGRVPTSEHQTMRAPYQDGTFTFPVKYGYSAVGHIQNGRRKGEAVFALFPHQARFGLPEDATIAVPQDVPLERAVLAANMETALNIAWDAGIGPGDKVAVVGCGVIGALVAYLAARMPGTEVTVVDVDPSRIALARSFGARFDAPDTIKGDHDVVIHTSASTAGLNTAIGLAGAEAAVVEASWFGNATTDIPLGGRFHQRRLRLIGSQVGRIPPHQAARWTFRRRLEKAMSLLADPVLDTLLTGETPFSRLADSYGAILDDPATLCHRIRYDD